MTAHLRTTATRRVAATIGAVLAVAAGAGPAVAAEGRLDPAIYEAEIPAGYVEHGIVAMTVTGTPTEIHRRTEYWATNDRWRSVTRDGRTGELLGESFGTENETLYFSRYRPARGGGMMRVAEPHLMRIPHRSTPPLAGWAPAYNRKLVQKGLLTPVAPITVAGVKGTLYQVPQERKTSDPSRIDQDWVTDDTETKTEIALEDGTYAPLIRQTIDEDNGQYGRFVQREELVLRERTTDATALNQRLSYSAKRRAVRTWRAKVRAFKARHTRRR